MGRRRDDDKMDNVAIRRRTETCFVFIHPAINRIADKTESLVANVALHIETIHNGASMQLHAGGK